MKRFGKQRNCINANPCSRGSVTAGVRRSAEGLAPRPPNVRRRQNRKRRRNSPAMSHEHKLPSSPPPNPMQPHAARPLSTERTMDAAPAGTPRRSTMCFPHERRCIRTERTGRQAGRQDSLPSGPCVIYSSFYYFIFSLSRHATLKTGVIAHVLSSPRGETEGSQMLRDWSGGGESFTAMLPPPGLVLRPLCFH